MEAFEGSQALQDYLQVEAKPTFNNFILKNQENLVKWSVNMAAKTSTAISGIWFERYKKRLKNVKPYYAKPRAPKFNIIVWNAISNELNLLRKSQGSSEDGGEGSSLVEKSDILLKLVSKKISGLFTENDKEQLIGLKEEGGGIKSRINNHILKLLAEDCMSAMEIELAKLLVSSAINLLDDTFVALVSEVLTPSQLLHLTSEKPSWLGMDSTTASELKRIIDSEDAEKMLIDIQKKKVELINLKEKNTDIYRTLIVIELSLEYMDLKIRKDASEMTNYRRFATLLDFVFKGLDIDIDDGDIVAVATQMEMQRNPYVNERVYGRKIDLLIKVKGISIELNCNEWKSDKSSSKKLQQQSKNIRSNCAVLTALHIMTKGDITSVMALDMVGTMGYLYLLEYKNDVYIATLVNTVFLPTEIEELEKFRETLNTLYIWRNFMKDQVKTVKKHILERSLASTATTLFRPDEEEEVITALPDILYSPKNTRAKKRCLMN